MSRATIVYVLMLLLGVGGLWLILGAGSRLRAPTDLSGAWGVGSEDPTIPETLGDTVNIEQSGRFVRLDFAKGLIIDVKLKDESLPDPVHGKLLDMIFEGPTWKMSALGEGRGGPLIVKLTGPQHHTFTIARNPLGQSPREAVPTQTANAAAESDAP